MRAPDCLACGAALGERAAFLCVRVAGNEKVHSWFECACGQWTVETWTDRFMGGSETHLSGPLDSAQGRTALSVAQSCPQPSDDRCDCDAHRRLKSGVLDWRRA